MAAAASPAAADAALSDFEDEAGYGGASPAAAAPRSGRSHGGDGEDEAAPPPAPSSCCPSCGPGVALTPFAGSRFAASPADADKVAFCFSCRRGFTQRDLAVRDQRQHTSTQRQREAASRVPAAVKQQVVRLAATRVK
jgi:hypothetical protein